MYFYFYWPISVLALLYNLSRLYLIKFTAAHYSVVAGSVKVIVFHFCVCERGNLIQNNVFFRLEWLWFYQWLFLEITPTFLLAIGLAWRFRCLDSLFIPILNFKYVEFYQRPITIFPFSFFLKQKKTNF